MKLIVKEENNLVFLTKSKNAVTTSRALAETFKKRHDIVLRKINSLKESDFETFTALKIAVSKYKDDSGKTNKEYVLNRDAYYFFAMGFTGKKANKFKIDFITAFNDMETWIKERLKNSLEYKVMAETLDEVRKISGKETKAHHYITEARLVNWVLTDKFNSLDREALTERELDLLFEIQKRNTVLIGAGMTYADRKESLKVFAELRKVSGVS